MSIVPCQFCDYHSGLCQLYLFEIKLSLIVSVLGMALAQQSKHPAQQSKRINLVLIVIGLLEHRLRYVFWQIKTKYAL